jgi:putative peptidoglycan lipid II flippase
MVLEAYAGGLAFYAALKVLAPVFYALDKPQIPFRVSVLGILLNLGFNLLFLKGFHLGLVSLPVTTSMIALLNFLQLYFMINREVGTVFTRKDLGGLLRIVLACAAMALVVWGLQRLIGLENRGFFINGLLLALKISLGALAYACAAWLLRLEEIHEMVAVLRRKLLRR